MSPINRGAPKDGRLNLDQQKRRAKELLKAFAAGDADAKARFAEHKLAAPKLADAQFVIARENGFPSWPKMKEHAEALAAARKAMSGKAPDTTGTLHIRCGSDIQQALKTAGFQGRFHEFSDPFCQGPVRDIPRKAFISERAAFIARDYQMPEAEVLKRQTESYGALDRLSQFEEIVLWFEHDSYDQLILAFLLAEFAEATTLPPVLLVCPDDVPAVSRFIGIGQLSPEVIRWLWSSRRPVGAAEFALGKKVWAAITSPSPLELLAIAEAGTPLIPPMAGALMRHLMELPSIVNGLSLTEQLALEVIAGSSPVELRQTFMPYVEREPLPFLGDTMFAHIVSELAAADQPAATLKEGDPPGLWRSQVSLTAVGRDLLANRIDWLGCGPKARFVGGVRIVPGQRNWRFDHARRAVVLK